MDNGSSLWGLDPGAASAPSSTLDESLPHSHAHEVPWAMAESEVPASHGDGGTAIGLAEAVAVAADWEVRHPMTVALPAGEDGVYSAIGYAFDAPSDERTVHINQYDGRALATYGFDQYPLLAKLVSQGIGLHEGRSLGAWSLWGALLAVVGLDHLVIRRVPQFSTWFGTSWQI